MDEIRYAILIGINDYTKSPLNGCVNDVKNVKKELIDKCNFNEENIYSFESDEENSIKDIYGQFKECLDNLKEKFNPEKDSIFFQFAGHGIHSDGKSCIFIHDNQIKINSIFKEISFLNPKYQFYLFDCCQSGGNVLTRGEVSDQEIQNYIDKSKGITLLYACRHDEYAKEKEGNGLLTKYFIEVLKDSSKYDDKGILCSNTLANYVKREMIDEEQNPVCETRDEGYYPFSAISYWKNNPLQSSLQNRVSKNKVSSSSDIFLFSIEERNKQFSKLQTELEKLVKNIYEEYEIIEFQRIDSLLVEKIYQNISEDYPVNFAFDIQKNKIDSLTSLFTPYTQPKKYSIAKGTKLRIFKYKSKDQFSTEFYIGYAVIQLKFGLGVFILNGFTGWGDEEDLSNLNLKKYLMSISDPNIFEIEEEKHLNFFKKIINEIKNVQEKTNLELQQKLEKQYTNYLKKIISV